MSFVCHLKCVFSEVVVHGKIVLGVHGGIVLLQSAICGHQAKLDAELVGCDYIVAALLLAVSPESQLCVSVS